MATEPASPNGQLPAARSPVTLGSSFGAQPVMNYGMTFRELATPGLRAFGGYVREDILPQLQGRQAMTVYREMSDNSPIIGGIIYAFNGTMRKVQWRVNPADDTPAAQAEAEWVEGVMHDMSSSWEDVVSEALSMVVFGFAPHEIVYKRRLGQTPGMDPQRPGKELPKSRFDDGAIGWRRLPIRGQDTILKWFFDENGQTTGLTQQPWIGPMVDIPIEKLLLFRPTQHKGNPEGRPLTLDTVVRTPSGWTTMGAIAVGDKVFDEMGAVRSVTGKSEVFKDRPVYEIEFATGTRIKADASHLWRVSNVNDRTAGKTRDMTTEQIFAEFERNSEPVSFEAIHLPSEQRVKHRKAKNLSCGTAPVLAADPLDLPLDPYVLGYWLGNGITTKAAFSVSKTDRATMCAQFEALGYRTSYDGNTTVSVSNGLLFGLRAAGVFGHKHIPAIYLLASPQQRLALLQGLMDADGHAPGHEAKDTASTFANVNMEIIAGVEELVRSLGSQPRVRLLERAGSLGGVVNGHQIVARQDSYEVRFMSDLPVHRLPRKKHAQVRLRTFRTSAHFIKSVQRVDNADTVCIEVDSPSHLFLAGEGMVPTHNSILRNAYRSYLMVKRLEEQEAILFERLNGIPVVRVPSTLVEAARLGDASAQAAMTAYKSMAINLRIDEQMGVVMASDMQQGANGALGTAPQYGLELVAPGAGRGQVTADETITRHQNNMLMSVLADFLSLGHGQHGTQALSVSKTDMFFQAIEGNLNSMGSVFNRHGLPRLWALNGKDPDLMPEIVPDLAQRIDLDVLSNFILRLAQSGMALFPQPELEAALLDSAGLPDITEAGGMEIPSEEDQTPVPIIGPAAAALMPTPPPPAIAGPGGKPPAAGSTEDKFAKMLMGSMARRLIRKAGPTMPIDSRRKMMMPLSTR